MFTIPTPFVGGGDGPDKESTRDQGLPRPFYPGQREEPGPGPEEAAPEGAAGSARTVDRPDEEAEVIRVEVVEEEEEPVATEPAAAEAVGIEITETEEAGPEPAPAEAAAAGATEPAADTTPQPMAAAPAAESPAPAAPDRAAEELEIPDFLLGPDGTVEEMPAEPSSPAESRDRLAETAEALQRGPLGPRIRTLAAELGALDLGQAVARAFAAGYLAGREEEGN